MRCPSSLATRSTRIQAVFTMNRSRQPPLYLPLLLLLCGALCACTPSDAGMSTSFPSGVSSPVTPESRMLKAIDSGDVDAVEALLANGISADLELGTGSLVFTPLHRAAVRNSATIIDLLVDAGADIEAWANGVTPLMIAAMIEAAGGHE